jgi:mono/diheme cytochrome c family protein
MLLGVAGCAREDAPAPAAPAPAPAAAPPPAATAAAETIRDSADPLQHGRYLVETVAGCGNCHTPRRPDGTPDPTKNLAGAFVIEEPVFKAYAKNLTPDMETGIGSWTEDQIVDAIRNARRPDGTFMGPPDVVRLVQGHVGHRRARDRQIREVRTGCAQRSARQHVSDGPRRTTSRQHLRPDRHERARRAEDGPVAYGKYLADRSVTAWIATRHT